MILFKISWRNLWRNRRRTIIELSSIGGAVFLCVMIVNMQSGMYPKMIEEGTRMGSGHVGFYCKDYLNLRRVGLTFPTENLISDLNRDPEVSGAYARIYVPGLAKSSHDSRGGSLVGFDFEKEIKINPLLKKKRIVEGNLPSQEKEALVGIEFARELNLKLGNKFVWMAQNRHGEMASSLFKVSGVIKTGIPEMDKGAVFVQRSSAAKLIGAANEAHEVAVLLKNHRNLDRFMVKAEDFANKIPNVDALSWKEAMPQIADAIKLDRTSGYIFFGFILVLVGIGTINTMLMSVIERVREFGMMRALGIGNSALIKIIFSEGLILGFFGTAIGLIFSSIFSLYTSRYGLDFSSLMGEGGQEFGGVLIEPVIYTGWDLSRTVVIIIIIAFLAIAASIYPTYRALRIEPAQSMRMH